MYLIVALVRIIRIIDCGSYGSVQLTHVVYVSSLQNSKPPTLTPSFDHIYQYTNIYLTQFRCLNVGTISHKNIETKFKLCNEI